jgi:hypothetical protein
MGPMGKGGASGAPTVASTVEAMVGRLRPGGCKRGGEMSEPTYVALLRVLDGLRWFVWCGRCGRVGRAQSGFLSPLTGLCDLNAEPTAYAVG